METKGIKRQTHSLKTLLKSKRFRRVFLPSILLVIPVTTYFYLQRATICGDIRFNSIDIDDFLGHSEFLIDTNVGNITVKSNSINNCDVYRIFDLSNLQVFLFDNNIQIGSNYSNNVKLGLPELFNKGELILSDNLILITESEIGVVDGKKIGTFTLDKNFESFIFAKKTQPILEDSITINRIVPVVKSKL